MAFLRITMLEPKAGREDEVYQLMEELDRSLSGAEGMLFSLVLKSEPRRVGRISLWLTKDGANREATSSHILSLRARLRYLSETTEERLLDVKSGYVPAGFSSLQDAAKLPAYFPSSARQDALPVA
jgi:hypothetical protein